MLKAKQFVLMLQLAALGLDPRASLFRLHLFWYDCFVSTTTVFAP